MADDWKTPQSISMMVHEVGELRAYQSTAVPGALHIKASNSDDYVTLDVVLFTDNAALASDIADAINAVVAKHKSIAETDATPVSAVADAQPA